MADEDVATKDVTELGRPSPLDICQALGRLAQAGLAADCTFAVLVLDPLTRELHCTSELPSGPLGDFLRISARVVGGAPLPGED